MRLTVLWFVREPIFQDVIDHRGDKRKAMICGGTMHRMRTDGKPIEGSFAFETRNKANDLVAKRLLDLPSLQSSLEQALLETINNLLILVREVP